MEDTYCVDKEPVEMLLECLIGERKADLASFFVKKPIVNDPLAGEVVGVEAIEKMLRESPFWSNVKGLNQVVCRVLTQPMSVIDTYVDIEFNGKMMPMRLYLAVDNINGLINSVARIYYCPILLDIKKHRPPIMSANPNLAFPADFTGAYQDALHEKKGTKEEKIQRIVETFEENGHFVGPLDNYYRGKQDLLNMFSFFYEEGDGVVLKFSTLIDDGFSVAIEFIIPAGFYAKGDRKGSEDFCGIAIYSRGPTGKIISGRSNDDNSHAPNTTILKPLSPSDWGPRIDIVDGKSTVSN
jgi:hypothetical protein